VSSKPRAVRIALAIHVQLSLGPMAAVFAPVISLIRACYRPVILLLFCSRLAPGLSSKRLEIKVFSWPRRRNRAAAPPFSLFRDENGCRSSPRPIRRQHSDFRGGNRNQHPAAGSSRPGANDSDARSLSAICLQPPQEPRGIAPARPSHFSRPQCRRSGCSYSAAIASGWPREARSKRSRFITLVHAATKSFTNFSLASAEP